MKVVAFNGSPHKKGNTFHLLKLVMEELEKEGIETELVHLPDLALQACGACYKCAKAKNGKCMGGQGDGINEAIAKMVEAHGVLIGTPTHFANVSGHVKNMIDRAGLVARVNGHFLTRKVGAAVVAARRAGAVSAFDAVNRFFQINGMIVPGSIYWNLGIGDDSKHCREDAEGTRTMSSLGANMAWLLKKLAQ